MPDTMPVHIHFVSTWRDDEGTLIAMDSLGEAYERSKSEPGPGLPDIEEKGEWQRAEEWDHPESQTMAFTIVREWDEPLPVEVTSGTIDIDDIHSGIPVNLEVNVSQG